MKFNKDMGFQNITKIVPDPEEHIWFIAEEKQLNFYPVYEETPQTVQQLIGECYGFDTNKFQRNFSWIICEDHNNTFHGVGS